MLTEENQPAKFSTQTRQGYSLLTGFLVEDGMTEKAGRKRIRRERKICPNPQPIPPLATSLSASSFVVIPTAVRPFQQEPVHGQQGL